MMRDIRANKAHQADVRDMQVHNPHQLEQMATEILLADRKARIGHKHENDWLSDNQLRDRRRHEVYTTNLDNTYDGATLLLRPADTPRRRILVQVWPRGGYEPKNPTADDCVAEGCDREAEKRSFCPAHYESKRAHPHLWCQAPECGNRKLIAKGLCRKHYLRVYKKGTLSIDRKAPGDTKLCIREGCEDESRALDMCEHHYNAHLWETSTNP